MQRCSEALLINPEVCAEKWNFESKSLTERMTSNIVNVDYYPNSFIVCDYTRVLVCLRACPYAGA